MNETGLTRKERRALKRAQKEQARQAAASAQTGSRIAKWLGLIVILGLVVWGLVWIVGQTPSGPAQAITLADPVTANDWVKGNANATSTLVEYSDFECPACGNYYPLLKQLLAEQGDKVKMVYRHFPLPQHLQARLAAQAAEAAGKQGKFWEMHDLLFDRQNVWSGKPGAADLFLGYATSLGLNLDQFKASLESEEVKNKVEEQAKSGERSRVNSTPTFFLNGVKIDNPASYEEFVSLLTPAL